MSRTLAEMYAHVAVHATANREHEAVIDLLLLVTLADRHIADDELDQIRTISEDGGWESSTFSFDHYLGQGMARVRAARLDNGVDALLDDIDGRITSSVLRGALFGAAREVAGVDNILRPEEEALLTNIAGRFG